MTNLDAKQEAIKKAYGENYIHADINGWIRFGMYVPTDLGIENYDDMDGFWRCKSLSGIENIMKHQKDLRKLEILNSEFDRDGLEMLLGSLWLSNGNTLEVREDEVIYCNADFEPIETLNAEESAFWFNHAQSLFYATDEYKSAKNRAKEEEYLNSLDELADLRHQQFREEN